MESSQAAVEAAVGPAAATATTAGGLAVAAAEIADAVVGIAQSKLSSQLAGPLLELAGP